MEKLQAIAKLNEILGEDVTVQFEEQEERSAVNGTMQFLVMNKNNLAVEVERHYDEENDELTYSLNEEWAK